MLSAFGSTGWLRFGAGPGEGPVMINELALAVQALASKRTGALIAIERRDSLAAWADTGIPLEARFSYDLLLNIFVPGTPLHDGAVIVRGDRIAGGLLLPAADHPARAVVGARHPSPRRHRPLRGDRRPGHRGLGGDRHHLAGRRGAAAAAARRDHAAPRARRAPLPAAAPREEVDDDPAAPHPLLFLLALVAAFLLWNSVARAAARAHLGPRRARPAHPGQHPAQAGASPRACRKRVSVQLRGPLSRPSTRGRRWRSCSTWPRPGPGSSPSRSATRTSRSRPRSRWSASSRPRSPSSWSAWRPRSCRCDRCVEGTPAPGFAVASVRVARRRSRSRVPAACSPPSTTCETTPVLVEGRRTTSRRAVQARLPHPLLRTVTAVPLLVVVQVGPEPEPPPTPTPAPRQRRNSG